MSTNSYLKAGINLKAAETFVSGISQIAKNTFNENVIGGIGGFAGLFRLPANYRKPVLVACTDGVGSKLKLAYQNNYFDFIGQDLVAMCVNDLLCAGAKPLFFLDYLATEKLDPEKALIIADSIAKACKLCNMPLLGGETAELPGMLPEKGYELAGFSVGIVEEDLILNPLNCTEKDVLIGLPSSGVHSNGYSLIRSVLENNKNLDLKKVYNQYALENSLLEEIMKPTKIYHSIVQDILPKVKAMAHITGGGLPENLPRAFNKKNLKAIIQKDSWDILPIFKFLQSEGNIDPAEMLKVFNLGLGLVLIVSPENKADVFATLDSFNEKYFEIGYLEHKITEKEPDLLFI